MSSILRVLHVARTGLQLQERNLSVKTQNIAAQGVDGYKRQYLVATDLPYQDFGNVGASTSDAGTIAPTGLQLGLGVQASGIYRMFTQGDPIHTGNSLDVMIEGDGFFQVAMPDGTTAYTRVGVLQMSPDGTLVMPKTGYPVFPNITIPSDAISVSINAFGEIFIQRQGQQTEESVGQFQMATFLNPSGLKAVGDSLFLETAASGTPDTGAPGSSKRGQVKQAWREGSNVNAVEEVTDLISIEKIYSMLTRVLDTVKSMMDSSNRAGA